MHGQIVLKIYKHCTKNGEAHEVHLTSRSMLEWRAYRNGDYCKYFVLFDLFFGIGLDRAGI